MIVEKEFTTGVFCRELKNRFRCEVTVGGKPHICYVASSSRLSNFIELEGKKVLLLPAGRTANSTEYTLFAMNYRNSYTLLELSFVNALMEEQIGRRCFSFLGTRKKIQREKFVDGYKADLFIEDTGTIVEVKTILSTEKEAYFPTVRSERTIKQLKKINNLLENGHSCCMLFISLCPTVRTINLNYDIEFFELFKMCVNKGLVYKAFKLKTTERSIEVDKPIAIVL